MWSRRFEQPLILRPPERRTLFCMALACWLPGIALLALARIPAPVAALLGLGLLVLIAAEFRGWSGYPASATWRPGRGWTLEWPGGRRRAAMLLGSSRLLPWMLALHWDAGAAGRVRLVVPTRPGDPTARRLRVLMRYGRDSG